MHPMSEFYQPLFRGAISLLPLKRLPIAATWSDFGEPTNQSPCHGHLEAGQLIRIAPTAAAAGSWQPGFIMKPAIDEATSSQPR